MQFFVFVYFYFVLFFFIDILSLVGVSEERRKSAVIVCTFCGWLDLGHAWVYTINSILL